MTFAISMNSPSGRMSLPGGSATRLVMRSEPAGTLACAFFFKVTVKGLLDDPYISARRPEGIQPAGFREIIFGIRWQHVEAPAPVVQ